MKLFLGHTLAAGNQTLWYVYSNVIFINKYDEMLIEVQLTLSIRNVYSLVFVI